MKLPPVLSSRHKEAIFLMKRMLCVLLTTTTRRKSPLKAKTGCTSMSFWRTERRALRAIWATKRRW